MAAGNKPLKKTESIVAPTTLNCMCCNNELSAKEFYDSDSYLHRSVGKIPYCKECLDKFYHDYLDKYEKMEYANPDRKAIERICMMLDLYYSDKIFDSAVKLSKQEKMAETPFISLYFKQVKMYQYRSRNYDTTIQEKYKMAQDRDSAMSIYSDDDAHKSEKVQRGIELFGEGFSDDDYVYLCREYGDWTTRHECNTKAQEQLFKQICHAQLNLLKAERSGADTRDIKDLSQTFQNLLDSANLKPKQNAGDAISDAQTFGTLIDKWENTRPIPEVESDLADVDGLGKYLDIFFKGGLARSLGLDIEYSKQYDEYMSRYTVNKPEYDEYEGGNGVSREIHEAIFGSDPEENNVGE